MARRLAQRERPASFLVGRQRWNHLLFGHWKIDAAEIQATLPPGLFVDTFEGDAYLGVVPFFMQRVRPAWLPPLPGVSWFLELNVRTYVFDAEGRPGVWFYSLDCNQPVAVFLARSLFHLPYFHAKMTSVIRDGAIFFQFAAPRGRRAGLRIRLASRTRRLALPAGFARVFFGRTLPAFYRRPGRPAFRGACASCALPGLRPRGIAVLGRAGAAGGIFPGRRTGLSARRRGGGRFHLSVGSPQIPRTRANIFLMNDQNTSPVWFITRCSSGLGHALALRALARGHRVVATARQPHALADLAASYPAHCRAFALDVTLPDQVQAVVAEAASAFGRLDVVVNNAGYGLVGALEELGDEQITRNFKTNFFGALRVIRAALPVLRAQGSGHIVNISAAAVISNYAGFSIYGATKWALEGASEALAAEVRPLGRKVLLVQPGPFRTRFLTRSLEKADRVMADYAPTSGKFARYLESMDGKQAGDPEKAAEAIIAAVLSDRPPLRLVLGKYATDKSRKKIAVAQRELDAWSAVGEPTDFSPAG